VLSLCFIPLSPIVNAVDTENPFNPIIVPSNSDNLKLVYDNNFDTDFEITNKSTSGTFKFIA